MRASAFRGPLFGLVCVASVLGFSAISSASHSWGNYHWARMSNPFTLKVGDNVTSAWDPYLDQAIIDWNADFSPTDLQTVLTLTEEAGVVSPKTCKPVTGKIQVCNAKYGRNGWLGIAGIYASGDHITKGYVKLNDTYFSTSAYNTPAWRLLVASQEIGHCLGLDHQDEAFDNPNLGTCMDYTNDPDGGLGGASPDDPSNEHPNAHDYDQLAAIYAHLDGTTTVAQPVDAAAAAEDDDDDLDLDSPGGWGRQTHGSRAEGHSHYELELPDGRKIFTFVIWAR